MEPFRHPFDCPAIKKFHQHFGRIVVDAAHLSLRDATALYFQLLAKFEARVGNNPLLRLHMQRMIQEGLFLEVVGREMSVATVLGRFKQLVALDFRDIRTKGTFNLILCRFLIEQGHGDMASKILEDLVQELRSYQLACKEIAATATKLLRESDKL